VGADLRHHRRAASRARRVCHSVQRNLARRPARLSYTLETDAGENHRTILCWQSLVSKLAARFAAGSDELAQLVRKDQDLSAEADRLDKNIITAVSKPPAERNPSAEDQIRKRIDDIKSERDKLQDVFNQRFPDYVALSKPQPLSVKQTQALLADDEALVVLDFHAKSYAWVITKTDAKWTPLKVDAEDLDAEVKTLRLSLTSADSKPFDTALSYKIYQETPDCAVGEH
jgi:hypothetical protein